jgi:2-iminoacetate synthase ThiH
MPGTMGGLTMPDDEETQAAGDQASDRVPKKRLATLISTKGLTPQEAAAEVMANWRKYKEASE